MPGGWTTWILASAVMLALYDLAKKASVNANAVIPTLLFSTIAGSGAFLSPGGGPPQGRELHPDAPPEDRRTGHDRRGLL